MQQSPLASFPRSCVYTAPMKATSFCLLLLLLFLTSSLDGEPPAYSVQRQLEGGTLGMNFGRETELTGIGFQDTTGINYLIKSYDYRYFPARV